MLHSKNNLDLHAKLTLCFSTMMDAAIAEEKAKNDEKNKPTAQSSGLGTEGKVVSVAKSAGGGGGGGGGVSHGYNGTKAEKGKGQEAMVATAESKTEEKKKTKGKKGEVVFECAAVDEARDRLQVGHDETIVIRINNKRTTINN